MILPRSVMASFHVRKPRASGDDPSGASVTWATGPVNPARAGMILRVSAIFALIPGKPRASGDDPNCMNTVDLELG